MNTISIGSIKRALGRLLDGPMGRRLAGSFVSFWKDQRAVLKSRQIRSTIKNGAVTSELSKAWEHDYNVFVGSKVAPEIKKAMSTGAVAEAGLRGLDIGYKFNTETAAVSRWVTNRTAELVTNCTRGQIESVKQIIHSGIDGELSMSAMERQIKSCVGLTRPQAAANMKYYENIKRTLKNDHPKMSAAMIEKKAGAAAEKYAARQLNYRAKLIAQTELAAAYEYGRFEHTRELIDEGFLPEQEKEWSSSADGRVCDACAELDGERVAMDDDFMSDMGAIDLPPLHPGCRCEVKYVDREDLENEDV